MSKRFFSKAEKEKFYEFVFITILFLIIWVGYIVRNCILVWPPFNNFKTCIQEQKEPAVKKAVEFPNVK